MTGGSNLVVPMVLWGRNAPTHCISTVLMTPDQRNIITGCNDGQIAIWDVTKNWEIYPRSMLFGHTSAISCLALGSSHPNLPYIVSASENGEMCLWDITDGRCVECTKMSFIHSNMQAYQFRKDVRLVCNGYYPEILIIDPLTFEKIYSLSSKVAPDWISACCVLRPVKRQDDVIVAISNSGAVKVWSLMGSENRTQPVYEDESKQIKCLNAQTLACCPFNQRTVLIVCSKYWQIYDAGDFTNLCSESNRCGERWSGGDFVSVDKVIVWSNEGKGYLYKLPTNCDVTQINTHMNATPESPDYHRQSHQPSAPHAYYILDMYSELSMACAPVMTFHQGHEENPTQILIRGDSEGQLVAWTLPTVTERQMTLVRQESFDRLPALPPRCSTTLQEVWDSLYQPPSGIIDGLCDEEGRPLHITSTIYIPSQGKVACGREDGSIVIAPATQSIITQLLDFKIDKDDITVRILRGHDGRVTCLLYPFNDSSRYEPNHLLSGGADFSVMLWDMYSGLKLHTFTVHGGEINQLIVPPCTCNTRILSSICSVASDHSVTLLSLKERKCIMLAGRHLFPVQTIKWRPLDDFMVVSCSDGTVYVWQMETGHLDRVVHGLTAEEILNNCDEHAAPTDQLINPNLTLAQAIKRRNLLTFKNLAQQKLQQQMVQQQQAQGARCDLVKPQSYPMYIQGVRTNTRNPDAHIIFFDTESLIVQLLTDEYALMSPGELEAKGFFSSGPTDTPSGDISEAQAKISGVMAKIKEKADSVGQKIQGKVDPSGMSYSPTASARESPSMGRRGSPKINISGQVDSNLTMEIAQLFMSCLHAWGLDPDLDKLCINKLGLLKPRCPISFGLISRSGHMSLMLPGWHKKVCHEEMGMPEPQNAAIRGRGKGKVTLKQQARSASYNEIERNLLSGDYTTDSDLENEQRPLSKRASDGAILGKESFQQQEMKIFSSKARWQISSGVTTQHLLSVISTANTLMSMSHATFATKRIIKKHLKGTKFGLHKGLLVAEDNSSEGGSEDESDMAMMQQSQIKQGWSLLAALHCVLLPEMVGSSSIQPPQLEMLARRWQDRCLEIREAAQALLLAELRRIGPEGRKEVVDIWSPYLPTYVDQNVSLMANDGSKGEEEDEDYDDEDPMVTGDFPINKTSTSFESRRKQATAIVMLGVVGAEFGHEMEPSRRKNEDIKKSRKASSAINQDGFTLTNYSLSRHTSKALMFLLQQAPSRRLPAHTPIRRASVDLLGRGFTVWEPYLDVSAVLMGLLELCTDTDRLVPHSMTFGLPLTPAADACRSARHALSLIATARPPAFIITIAKEVARYNAIAQTAQSQHSNIHNNVLVKSKQEILRVVELLVEKMPNDVADHLVEVMDVTMHCLDPSQLKSKGLMDLFPAICRFSMVTVCPVSKRIWVGAKNGGLAFYDLKQHSKCQMTTAHSGPVVATCVSPDGKYLATYSHFDNRLKFWQTASSSLFGIGSQQTKCVKSAPTPPCPVTNLTNLLKLVRLVWVDPRTVIMLTVDGSEHRYSV
ncbi:WD repeat-containing protein 7-like isoform X1 [Mizuhopecten yessoensis]|uniref:WD repeat-containing protein 7-like isoform X1 n=1 Tax=Mizuhopecten yessoensis TaxID=6573 RepID=UPI000B45B9CA|nr:WD repeat-containing protein 7-like isoform X1 [Mizuhopecten yessoensis]